MSSSTDAVLPADAAERLAAVPIPELRTGEWTRRGGSSVLGDAVTEGVLGELATRTQAAARAQGYAVGWGEGRRQAAVAAEAEAGRVAARAAEAEERREAEHRAALAALAAAAADLRALATQVTATVSEQATGLAWALTETIVGSAAASCEPADVLSRVLDATPPGVPARVRLHPDLAQDPGLADVADLGLVVVPDPTLGRGDALVELDGSVVDLRVDEALARVREVLR